MLFVDYDLDLLFFCLLLFAFIGLLLIVTCLFGFRCFLGFDGLCWSLICLTLLVDLMVYFRDFRDSLLGVACCFVVCLFVLPCLLLGIVDLCLVLDCCGIGFKLRVVVIVAYFCLCLLVC